MANIDYTALLRTFPPVRFAFAYGSAVFPQKGYEHVLHQANGGFADAAVSSIASASGAGATNVVSPLQAVADSIDRAGVNSSVTLHTFGAASVTRDGSTASSKSQSPNIARPPATGRGAAAAAAADAPMVDLIFAVDDTAAWHESNMRMHRSHYSGLVPYFGSSALGRMTDAYGAGLWYNTLVPMPTHAPPPLPAGLTAATPASAPTGTHAAMPIPGVVPGQTMKYGVISVDNLLLDLLEWRHMYTAGRMHKPVRIISLSTLSSASAPATPATALASGSCADAMFSSRHKQMHDVIIDAANENLRHALRAALLMLPSRFTALQLYETITGLSYFGDWRMVFGENPDKVRNIVSKQVWRFHQLYTPIMTANTGPGPAHPFACILDVPAESSTSTATAPFIDYSTADEETLNRQIGSMVLRQDTSPQARLALAMGLPSTVQRRMAGAWGEDTANAGSSGRFSSGGDLDTAASPASPSVFSAAQPANRIADRIQHRLYDALGHRDRQWLSAALREHSYYSRTQSQGHQPARSATAAPTPTGAPAEQRRASYAGVINRGRETLRRLHMIRVAALVEGRDRQSLRRNHQISPQTLPPQSNNGFGSVGGLMSSAGSASTDPSIQRFWSAMMAAAGSTAASPAAGSSVGATASGTVVDLSVPLSRYLRPAIGSIVGSAARSQSIKGIVSAGAVKSAVYASSKLRKYFAAVLKVKG